MKSQTNCKNCGIPIPANSPSGICPKCTFGLAMNDQAPHRGSLASTAMGGSFIAPRPEDLQNRFDNLEIIELLGHGGMGAVYKARQKNLDRIVALKVLSPRLTDDPSFAQRFTREARTLAKLAHPNIVMVFEFGTAGDMHYLLMEFVDGVDLRTAMRERILQPDQALPVVQQVCEALQYAHDQGIVHRDIKPENILLGRDGKVKIADFGLAKLVQSESYEHSITGTQQVVGTRNYMAPEQIETPTNVDHRADIYSLGVVFYELLTGELPLGRFAAPSEKAEVNNRLDEVVMRTLEKEPARRYQQASHVQTAVESIDAQSATAANQHRSFKQTERSDPVLHLPFSIPDLYGGFAVAHGIAHFDGSEMELEFDVRDDILGAVKSKPQRVTISVNELSDAEYKSAAFSGSGRLTITAAHLDAVNQVPNNQQGQFVLSITKDNRRQAEEFADAIVNAIRSGGGPVKRTSKPRESKKPWTKVFVAGIGASELRSQLESALDPDDAETSAKRHAWPGGRDEAARNVRGPALGLLATGIINALIAVGLLISFIAGTISWVGSLADRGPAEAPAVSSVSLSTDGSTELASAVAESAFEADGQSTNAHSEFLPIRWSKNFFNVFRDFSFGTFIFSAGMAVLLVFASLRMMQLKDYQFCVFAAVLAVIPLHGAAFLGIGFGIWALVMLNKPEVKEAFSISAQPSTAGQAPPAKGMTPAAQWAAAMQAPSMVFFHIFKVLLVVGMCLLFSFGLIYLIRTFVSNGSDRGEIRPEFRASVTEISERIDEYEQQFEERIDNYESTANQKIDSTAADHINEAIEKEYVVLQAEIDELKKSAGTTAEFNKLNSRAARLLRERNKLKSRIQEIEISPATKNADDGNS